MSPIKTASRTQQGGKKIAPGKNLLRRMPKVDIHCHLDGSLRPATVLELARERKIKLPADTVQDITPFVQVAPACQSLQEFLKVFHLLYPLLRDAAALERIAYELCEDCAAENIRHVEVRFAPILNATQKFTVEDAIEAALKGLRRGLRDFGVTSGLILCLHRPPSPQENQKVFIALKRFFKKSNGLREPGVVGMDLAGDEAMYSTMHYADFFEEAHRLGIPTTCHAGETVGTANIEASLALRVLRIGHGTNLITNRKLLEEVVRRKIPLEVGITSNVRTKSVPNLESHPVMDFHHSGVPFSLNTDDRGVIGIDLTHEYETAQQLGFALRELSRIAVAAVDHLFLPPADRAALRGRFESEHRRLFEGFK